ncbi:zinc ribbon domain-containing protein [Saccharicrinis sp. FJH2]|uniref:zinc ribbon domain-containing protein n=1 Tax=Saccharicrinis sp. FJH65 TaxID=3344659 RepID=UPI0035F37793
MEKPNKMCQSCGMPLSKDAEKGGTNADGTKNLKYCSYCYQNGEFTFKGSVKEFQEFCRQKMVEQGHGKFTAWLFTRGLKRLERWKN